MPRDVPFFFWFLAVSLVALRAAFSETEYNLLEQQSALLSTVSVSTSYPKSASRLGFSSACVSILDHTSAAFLLRLPQKLMTP